MEENPGQSLFQGICIENAAHEEEDIEEQRRRQEEIRNYLKGTMDDFVYDDQSTINSSVNISVEEVNRSDIDKYKDAHLDDQLRVLYEVRVREVQALKNELESLKSQFTAEKESSRKQYILCEAEKLKAQMSLQECQGLLSEKNQELYKLHKDIEEANKLIVEQKEELIKLADENASNKSVINELHKQIKCLEQDLPLKCQISSDQVIESRNREISKLQQLLETANKQIDVLEGKVLTVEKDLKKAHDDKEKIIIEKNDIIFRLTYSVEDAQKQCKELLTSVETLSKDNARLRDNLCNAEAELSKRNHAVDIAQVKILNETVNKDKKLLEEKEAEINNLKRLLNTFQNSKKEHKILNHSVQVNTEESLMEHFNQILKEKNNIQIQLEMCNVQLKELHERNSILQKDILNANEKIVEKNDKIDQLLKKLKDVEIQLKKETEEQARKSDSQKINKSTQNVLDNIHGETESLNREVESYKAIEDNLRKELDFAQNKLSKANEEITSLRKQKVSRENREKLIEDLQNQAAKFEELIIKQQKYLVTTSTNTEEELYDKNELNKLVEEKMNSLNGNLLKDTSKYVTIINAQKEEIGLLQNKLLEDRHVMASVFEKWSEKVHNIEQQLHIRNGQLKIIETELEKSKMNEEKLQKNVFNLQKEMQLNLKLLNDYKTASAKILKTGRTATNILEKITKADNEVQKIEQRFRKHRKHLIKDCDF